MSRSLLISSFFWWVSLFQSHPPALAEGTRESGTDSYGDAILRLLVKRGVITEEDSRSLKAEVEQERQRAREQAVETVAEKAKPKVDIGLQYRVMYNAANIPPFEKSTFSDPEDYDFFRQRFRLSVDIKPHEQVGGFTQFEFRNAWGVGPGKGGVAPPTDVAFNRLDARGIRYGYIYYLPSEEHTLNVGILPISDRVGDTLFSADWDFNVGGINYLGGSNNLGYRLCYVRLVDTLGSDLDRDGHFFVGDLSYPVGETTLGAHLYFLSKDQNSDLPGFLGQEAEEGWYAVSASSRIAEVGANAFVMINSGKIEEDSHTGVAVKGEVHIPLPDPRAESRTKLSLLAIYTTGDEEEEDDELSDAFMTPQGLLGTEGYWQYTHIFSANGPSDVNDLAIEIGNAGAGLFTLQSKIDCELAEWLSGQLDVGWLRATEERNDSNDMGWEFGGMLTFKLTQFLNLEVGAAGAFLGDFFAGDSEDLYEVFSRFQLEF